MFTNLSQNIYCTQSSGNVYISNQRLPIPCRPCLFPYNVQTAQGVRQSDIQYIVKDYFTTQYNSVDTMVNACTSACGFTCLHDVHATSTICKDFHSNAPNYMCIQPFFCWQMTGENTRKHLQFFLASHMFWFFSASGGWSNWAIMPPPSTCTTFSSHMRFIQSLHGVLYRTQRPNWKCV